MSCTEHQTSRQKMGRYHKDPLRLSVKMDLARQFEISSSISKSQPRTHHMERATTSYKTGITSLVLAAFACCLLLLGFGRCHFCNCNQVSCEMCSMYGTVFGSTRSKGLMDEEKFSSRVITVVQRGLFIVFNLLNGPMRRTDSI